MTYTYECPSCKERTDVVRSIVEQPVSPLCFASGCDGVVMERVIDVPSFILKGSGWARDGYSGKK